MFSSPSSLSHTAHDFYNYISSALINIRDQVSSEENILLYKHIAKQHPALITFNIAAIIATVALITTSLFPIALFITGLSIALITAKNYYQLKKESTPIKESLQNKYNLTSNTAQNYLFNIHPLAISAFIYLNILLASPIFFGLSILLLGLYMQYEYFKSSYTLMLCNEVLDLEKTIKKLLTSKQSTEIEIAQARENANKLQLEIKDYISNPKNTKQDCIEYLHKIQYQQQQLLIPINCFFSPAPTGLESAYSMLHQKQLLMHKNIHSFTFLCILSVCPYFEVINADITDIKWIDGLKQEIFDLTNYIKHFDINMAHQSVINTVDCSLAMAMK